MMTEQLEKVSGFCDAMAAQIYEMTQLSDCDAATVREEIDNPVSFAWDAGPKSIAVALHLAIGQKYRISQERLEKAVDSYFEKENGSSTENGQARVEDPALALEALTRTVKAECSELQPDFTAAVYESVDFSQEPDKIAISLRRALAKTLLPSHEDLRAILLKTVPELEKNSG